jgi:hypothetical protein
MSGSEGTSRRRFLVGAAGLVGGGIVAVTTRDLAFAPAGAAAPQPTIKPRTAWAGGLSPTGPLPVEKPEDVKFLLVHHTAGANGYAAAEVPETLRAIFRYHTGPKGWNDVAYNFFIDAYGGIWEGRQGSLTAPVMGDATGGSQGHGLLCCFMGDHSKVPPTAAALASMTDLLAWLAGRYAIDLRPGATASFVSRGSNLHPAGKTVTTPTIAAHREMSRTACPGDACFRLVKGELSRSAALKAGASAGLPGAPPTVVAADPAEPLTPGTTLPPASPTQIDEDNPPPSTIVAPATPPPASEGGGATGTLVGLGGLSAATAAVAGAVIFRRRRARAARESRWYRSELLNPPDDGPPQPPR